MCVCEPQSVSTAATYSGWEGSLMSKTRMPSHDDSIEALCPELLHEASLRLESTLSTRMSPHTEMSFCEPGHTTWVTATGAVGSLMS